jgi:hypothetical protein
MDSLNIHLQLNMQTPLWLSPQSTRTAKVGRAGGGRLWKNEVDTCWVVEIFGDEEMYVG